MNPPRDDEYQDPRLMGSLVGAFHAWQVLVDAADQVEPQHLAFAFSCPSESRARRVAAFLRRRIACETTRVSHVDGRTRDEWRVDGVTRHEIQSLRNLERLFTWLRTAAQSHQVALIGLAPQ